MSKNTKRRQLLSDAVCVTTPEMYKRAALLFERIECFYHGCKEIGVDPGVPEEIAFKEALFSQVYKFEEPITVRLAVPFYQAAFDSLVDIAKCIEHDGYSSIILFPSSDEYNINITQGSVVALQAVLNNLALIDEKQLEWSQVLEFRKDQDALLKYRNLRIWLSDALAGKSEAQATDIINKKLDDYNWAIKKHGLKTITGALTSVLDPKGIISIASGATIATLTAGPVWAAIAAGAIALGKVSVWVAERAIDLKHIKRGEHSEIALIYDINKEFGGQ